MKEKGAAARPPGATCAGGKQAVAANRLADSIDELVAKARHYFEHDLLPHPAILPIAA
jgi:hypothetical protein